MYLPDFKVEQWMTDYEQLAIFNLTDTCVDALSLQDLLDFQKVDCSSLSLDYGEICGDKELRKEILSLYSTGTIDNITCANGCLQANELVMHTLLSDKDHVITLAPGYQQFWDVPKSLGCEVSIITLQEKNNWMPTIEDFKDCFQENTKLIIINNPNNPTGTCLSQEFLEELIKLCRQKNIYILCDEVYRDPMVQTYSISDHYELGISTGSLSKMYALAGLRFGWVKANLELIHQINVRRDYSMISTGPLVDKLACIALSHKEEILTRSKYIIENNKKVLKDWLKENPHFTFVFPECGSVGFLKYDFSIPSKDFALRLLKEKGIFFVPGSCFDLESHFRLGLGRNEENFKNGLEQLSIWTKENME
ncbi:MAG: aminotransferase class I/II-fold pyridoxal phosphate-dependent enzyme [Bacillota bacterium]|nr:aminotransferase class I/II-fold pyridoxal phosphate-dependent enzyme [Bacillota bacterium]